MLHKHATSVTRTKLMQKLKTYKVSLSEQIPNQTTSGENLMRLMVPYHDDKEKLKKVPIPYLLTV